MVKIAPTQGIQLELLDSCVELTQESTQTDSCVELTQESTQTDSCANSQLSPHQYKILISYLTKRNEAERKYGSGWLDISKSAGTARTDNQYIRYNYRVHWRKRPIVKHIGKATDAKNLQIAQAVRQAIDQQKPTHEIVKLIEKLKQDK